MSVLVLTEQEIRQVAGLNESALTQVEQAFTWLDQGLVSMPPVMHIEVDEQSDVDIKGAYVKGQAAFAVKMASGFFGNAEQGLPTGSGMVVLLSAETGFCQCVFLDNGYLTDLRTGLAGAVGARHLAPEHVDTVGVLGAGAQARYQVESLKLVRDFNRVLVSGRTAENQQRYAIEMADRLGVDVTVADSVEQLVKESQVVVTTTPSRTPVLSADWIHPGLHITAMGSDLPGKQELDPVILGSADLVVCDSRAQCEIGGELQHGVRVGAIDAADVVELGRVTSGQHPGRETAEQITVSDLTGTGVQDTAIALAAYAAAVAKGCGTTV